MDWGQGSGFGGAQSRRSGTQVGPERPECAAKPQIFMARGMQGIGFSLWELGGKAKGKLMNIKSSKYRGLKGWVRSFGRDEGGLVTVEWVALAGAVVIGGITVVWLVMNNLQTPASNVGSNLTACESFAASHSGSTSGCT